MVSGQQHAPAALYPRERPGTHFKGGWEGTWAGLDGCGKSRPYRDSIPDRPAHSQSLYRISYPAHIYIYIYIYKHIHTRCYKMKKFTDMSWVRESVANISWHILELNSILVRRWFVVDKIALRQVLLQVLLFSLVTIVLLKRRNHSSITAST